MEILINFFGIIRAIFMFIDTVFFGLVDNAYNLISDLAGNRIFDAQVISSIRINLYVIMGLFAFFRIAVILVNSMINPDKLNEKGNGITNVGINILIMFVLLIAVPIVFEKAYEYQGTIVKDHIVEKMFLNTDTLEESDPGRAMQSIAIGSLITWNDNITSCTGKCEDAKKAYENMAAGKTADGTKNYKEGGFKLSSLSKYAAVTGKTSGGDEEFVYNYPPLVTCAVGLFLTYILFSFAIDIGVRTVELVVLEIISPLFIATYIDPKSAKSGPFKNWVTTTLKTYASLFIKLAIISLMLLLVSLIPQIDFSGWKAGSMGQLTLLIAILIFAKKAPEWIGKLIGTDVGLGGLGIGKKLGSAALIGGAVSKALPKLKNGGVSAGVANAVGWYKSLKDSYHKIKKINDEVKANEDKSGSFPKRVLDRRKASSEKRKEEGLTYTEVLKRAVALGASSAIVSAKVGAKANNATAAISAGITGAAETAGRVGISNEGFLTNLKKQIKRLPGKLESTYGSASERADQRETIEKQKKAESWTEGGNNGAQDAGIGKGKVVVGQGDANKVMNAMVKSGIDVTPDSFAAVQYGLNQGKVTLENGEIKGLSASGISLTSDGKINGDVKFGDGTTVSGDAISKDCGGVFDRDSSAMLNQEKFVNSYQTTTVNNYSDNNQTMQQAVSAYNAAKQNVSDDSLRALSLREGFLQALNQFDFGAALNNLSIGDSLSKNLSNIENAINESKKKLNTASDEERSTIEKQIKQLEDMQEKAEDFASKVDENLLNKDENVTGEEVQFYSTMKENMHFITQINDAQKELKQVIDVIPGNTTVDKVNNLAISSKKIDERINSIENKEKKD